MAITSAASYRVMEPHLSTRQWLNLRHSFITFFLKPWKKICSKQKVRNFFYAIQMKNYIRRIFLFSFEKCATFFLQKKLPRSSLVFNPPL